MSPSVPFSKVGRKQIHGDMTDVSRAETWCRNDCEYDHDMTMTMILIMIKIVIMIMVVLMMMMMMMMMVMMMSGW